MKDFFFTFFAVMSLLPLSVSCGAMKLNNQEKVAAPSGLHAVLYPDSASFPSSREGHVNARIVNSGTADAAVDMWRLGQSMTALVVISAVTGERMLTVGPATPPTPEEMKRYLTILKPGGKIEINYTLHMFSPGLPRGKYTVRMASIPSNSVSFIIR